MTRLTAVLAALFALSLAPRADAESLVQITLSGTIHTEGGAQVELQVGAWIPEKREVREVTLALHLAENTTASDLAALAAARFQGAGLSIVVPPVSGDPKSPRAQIFVSRAHSVRLRMGSGLSATVTACEEAPASVRFVRPSVVAYKAQVTLSASTFHPHTEVRGQRTLTMELGERQSSAEISGLMFKTAMAEKWNVERPNQDDWRPVKMMDGSRITGFTVHVESGGDWKLEVVLPAG